MSVEIRPLPDAVLYDALFEEARNVLCEQRRVLFDVPYVELSADPSLLGPVYIHEKVVEVARNVDALSAIELRVSDIHARLEAARKGLESICDTEMAILLSENEEVRSGKTGPERSAIARSMLRHFTSAQAKMDALYWESKALLENSGNRMDVEKSRSRDIYVQYRNCQAEWSRGLHGGVPEAKESNDEETFKDLGVSDDMVGHEGTVNDVLDVDDLIFPTPKETSNRDVKATPLFDLGDDLDIKHPVVKEDPNKNAQVAKKAQVAIDEFLAGVTSTLSVTAVGAATSGGSLSPDSVDEEVKAMIPSKRKMSKPPTKHRTVEPSLVDELFVD